MCPLECVGTRGLVGQLLPVGTVLNLVRVGAGSAAVPCPNALYDGTEQCNHQTSDFMMETENYRIFRWILYFFNHDWPEVLAVSFFFLNFAPRNDYYYITMMRKKLLLILSLMAVWGTLPLAAQRTAAMMDFPFWEEN